ncbi:MAG: carbohydrate-binding protein [Oscillospiraceae bacterium]|nr:MAG: carbohydrate-binding protein [Oscillospiraceae bacterium]
MPDTLTLKVMGKTTGCKAQSSGEGFVSMVYDALYQAGDAIVLETERQGTYCVIQLEDTKAPALVYIPGQWMTYPIPSENARINHSPRSFTGSRHLIHARLASQQEIACRRNLALNPYDSHESEGLYPHASANVETRGELVFAACNAIDGFYENTSHGMWPYQSWGINRNPNATMLLEFGRPVLLDELRLTLRADFPHDSWWTSATVTFSDDSTEVLSLGKSCQPQRFPIKPRCVEWLRLEQLIKANDDSPFPALTQIEAWGTEGDR